MKSFFRFLFVLFVFRTTVVVVSAPAAPEPADGVLACCRHGTAKTSGRRPAPTAVVVVLDRRECSERALTFGCAQKSVFGGGEGGACSLSCMAVVV